MITHRLSTANNKYMGEKYDPSLPSKYLMYLDMNNLYGFAMMQPMPSHDFRWLTSNEIEDLEDIKDLDPQGEDGYFLEVSISI